MPLIKTADMLRHARKHQYGVAAFNTFNYETVKWAVEAAEELSMPVVVQVYPGFEGFIKLAYLAHIAKDFAKRSPAPVAVHLDHSATYDVAVGGIRDGFPSVMYDGSRLPFAENAAVTADVVKVSRVFGADVEAELGHVGSGADTGDFTDARAFTDPAQAEDFVKRTGCDALAVAVGNAHGPYAKEPDLDFERIRAIAARVAVPLVLHGCSGIPDAQMQKAVALGMCKFNVATEYFKAVADAMKGKFEEGEAYADRLALGLGEGVKAFLTEKMLLLNPLRKTCI
jgi:ketose-bisphosphate aldolase